MDDERGNSAAASLQREVERLRDDIVACLRALVRIPSITGDEAAIGAHVADRLRAMGLHVEVLEAAPGRPNVVATWDSGIDGPTLLLNDHLDIVPPGPLENWTHPPFAAEIADGRVFGRGAIDTKSGLTTLLMATQALRNSGLPIRGKLLLIFSCDEEVGGALGIQKLAEWGRLKADLAIVAEPTGLQVEIATKGRLNIEITTKGTATHGARPWLGHSAIEDMMAVIRALQAYAKDLEKRVDPLLGHPTINVGIIQGGTVPNMVPSFCRIEVDRRFLPTETPEQVIAEFQDIVDRVGAGIPGFSATVKKLLWWPGYKTDPNGAVVHTISNAFRAVLGRAPVIAGKDAGTDASWIHQLEGIPVVMFSPGDGMRAMNADENVGIDDLITATKVIAQVLHDVLVQPATPA
jgi:acetylornithine deacetylase/succinyl-diaminopimelate desuccinylase family protein